MRVGQVEMMDDRGMRLCIFSVGFERGKVGEDDGGGVGVGCVRVRRWGDGRWVECPLQEVDVGSSCF